jgi:alkyl hydroperoxide reductase subunit AhpF
MRCPTVCESVIYISALFFVLNPSLNHSHAQTLKMALFNQRQVWIAPTIYGQCAGDKLHNGRDSLLSI